jgi:hypothetical protein
MAKVNITRLEKMIIPQIMVTTEEESFRLYLGARTVEGLLFIRRKKRITWGTNCCIKN